MKPPIRIYTVTWCPHCIRFKAWLDESRIAYLDHDVDFDDAAWREALILTGGDLLLGIQNLQICIQKT